MARVQVQFGGRTGAIRALETNGDLVVVRTRDRRPLTEAPLSGASRQLLDRLEPVIQYREAGVEVFHVRDGSVETRDRVRRALTAEPAIHFAGRVLSDPAFQPGLAVRAVEPGAPFVKEPVLYTENLFIGFAPTIRATAARRLIADAGLRVKRAVEYVERGYFVSAPDGTGLPVFEMALELLRRNPVVAACHPELIRPREWRGAFPLQWHLHAVDYAGERVDAHAAVVEAWAQSTGRGVTIAVIDTGIDVDHEEFRSRGKVVAPRDATAGSADPADPRPRHPFFERHGTACAGVACANGRHGASGVAPHARLLPIRLMAGLGSQSEADAIAWAVDHGADVISCSWGPIDGDWWDGDDPAHRAFVPLPDSTRLAIEYALTKGRAGKGCVVCWAAGNGNESVDNDGYASHGGVIAVAACNDRGTRSAYSDTGDAIWCAFPSGDVELPALAALPDPMPHGGVWGPYHPPARTPGIWTTDWSGPRGYNAGLAAGGDAAGHYTATFGGTSSAAPGVAGVAALMLAANPGLSAAEVKVLLGRACDPVDQADGHYHPDTGHSPLYGYGRVNAARAVALAAAHRTTARRPARSRAGRRR